MPTKTLSFTLFFFCLAAVVHAQNEHYELKSKPFPYDYKTPLTVPKYSPPLPTYPKLLKCYQTDTSKHFSHHNLLGNVYIAGQDGMPILQPDMQQLRYEKQRSIINLEPVQPFGKPNFVYPMPNPLKKALLSEEKTS